MASATATPNLSRTNSILQSADAYDPLQSSSPLADETSVTTDVEADDSDEEFRYPGASPVDNSPKLRYEVMTGPLEANAENNSPESSSAPAAMVLDAPEPLVVKAATPAQLESLASATVSGDLERLQILFTSIIAETGLQSFVLANDAAPRTGLTVLHHAASRGHLSIVEWLTRNCGAMVDLEDKEGETALHKAALHGHLAVVKYLLTSEDHRADVHAQDADGWTALHNACSKGYLDIVRFLCERAGAADYPSHDTEMLSRGVDMKSKQGWTPLMNASSKGHLPVVLYLLTKQNADPFVRNNWGETAYDVAAAVFEIWICEVLQRAEAERWRSSQSPYDPLAVHTTVPLILIENQRLDTRLKTIAVSGGRPKFSAAGLGRRGRRGAFELRTLKNRDGTDLPEVIPAFRSDVQLPLVETPFTLPHPKVGKDHPSLDGAERSHFWLSDWTLDLTHPKVNANEGWQYAKSFDDPDDRWAAEIPPPLERLLSGGGLVAGLAPRADGLTNSSSSAAWVRRRRWVRVMRRRLDIPPLPFAQPDGAMYQLTEDGSLVPTVWPPHTEDGQLEGQEMGSMPTSFLSAHRDYISRARYLAGQSGSSMDDVNGAATTALDLRKAINKLERAVNELRSGMFGDEDQERRGQADALLNTYNRELEHIRLQAGASGIDMFQGTYADDADEDYDSDESFHYPTQSPAASIRAPSIRSQVTDYFGISRASSSRTPADLTPHLSSAPEFRVPTHEAPQKVGTPRWTPPTPHQVHAQWQRDENVTECNSCRRRFTFYFRKHHCRRCGRIFCDRCSSKRALLDPAEVVQDPAYPEPVQPNVPLRVCDTCHDEASASVPSPLRTARSSNVESIVIAQSHLAVPGSSRAQSSSQLSDLADCPVCGQNLAELGDAASQEYHVKSCLDGGARSPSGIVHAARYIVYKLPPESSLIGEECVICLEDFVKGSLVARMSCLCTFHSPCLSAWLQRGRACPVHARDT